jgi:hypothetical protein
MSEEEEAVPVPVTMDGDEEAEEVTDLSNR